jgi:hypothetical protein
VLRAAVKHIQSSVCRESLLAVCLALALLLMGAVGYCLNMRFNLLA